MAKRAHGVPETRGPLRIYRDGELVQEISRTVVDKQARAVVRDHQARGRLGRTM